LPKCHDIYGELVHLKIHILISDLELGLSRYICMGGERED